MATSTFLSPSNNFISTSKFAVSQKQLPPPSSISCRQFQRISASYATTAERPITGSRTVSPPASMYEILEINMGATCQEIKSAYRRLARLSHPDVASKGKNDSADEFIRIHAAYTTLLDPRKRADYDRTLFRGHRRPTSTMTFRESSSSSRFHGYTGRRSWETDQCW